MTRISDELRRAAEEAGVGVGFYAAYLHAWRPGKPREERPPQAGAESLLQPVGEAGYVPATIFVYLLRCPTKNGVLAGPISHLLEWKHFEGPKVRARHAPQFELALKALQAAGFIEPRGPDDDPWSAIVLFDKTPPLVLKTRRSAEPEEPEEPESTGATAWQTMLAEVPLGAE